MLGFLKPKNRANKAQQPDPESFLVRHLSSFRDRAYEPKERPLREQFRSWAYIACERNAHAVGCLPVHVLTADRSASKSAKGINHAFRDYLYKNKSLLPHMNEDTVEVMEHPILSVLANPNPLIDQFHLLRLTVIYLQMRANAYWYAVYNQLGEPMQFWPLPSQFMWPILGDNVIERYELRYRAAVQEFDADEIIHFRWPGPIDMIRGFSPSDGVSEEVELDLRMIEYERALFENMALPDYIVTPDATGSGNSGRALMQPDQTKTLEGLFANLFRGWRKRGKGLFWGTPLKVDQLSMNNRDLQFKDGKGPIREKVAAGFGVPDALLSLDGSTFNNMRQAKLLWGEATLAPLSMCIMGQLNRTAMMRYGSRRNSPSDPNGRPDFWLVQDNPVPEDELQDAQIQAIKIDADIWTRNEARSNDGKEPHEDGRGDRPLPVNEAFSIEEIPRDGLDGGGEEAAPEPKLTELASALTQAVAANDVAIANMLRAAIADSLGQPRPADIDEIQPAPGGGTVNPDDAAEIEQEVPNGNGNGGGGQGAEAAGGKAGENEETPEDREKAITTKDDPPAISVSEDGDFTPRSKLEEFVIAVNPDIPVKLSRPRVEHGLEDGRFISDMKTVFAAMEQSVLAKLSDVMEQKSIKGSRDPVEGMVDTLLDPEHWEGRFKSAAEQHIASAYAKGADLGLADLQTFRPGDDITEFLISAEKAKERVDEFMERFASSVVDVAGDDLGRVLRKGLDSGDSIDEMSRRVAALYGGKKDSSSTRIVRTEISQALNMGASDQWKEAGIKKSTWLTAPQPCEFCEKMSGRVRSIGKAFAQKGHSIRGARGGVLKVSHRTIFSPPLHPNCICTLVPVVE